jgi:cytochrome o ubiquinol oxidase subunit 3
MSTLLKTMHEEDTKTSFGFWVYLMTDCMLFAALFAVYAVLHNNIYTGPSGKEIFNLPFVLTETALLLTSSYTCGLAMLAAHKENKNQVIGWLTATLVLGASFLTMELTEFSHLISDGHGPSTSGFLSSYFTLVATHGIHITIGILWMVVLMARTIRRGIVPTNRLLLFSLFWHFLDIIWIFIFSIVYLMGAR